MVLMLRKGAWWSHNSTGPHRWPASRTRPDDCDDDRDDDRDDDCMIVMMIVIMIVIMIVTMIVMMFVMMIEMSGEGVSVHGGFTAARGGWLA
jgi:hypothetical protein